MKWILEGPEGLIVEVTAVEVNGAVEFSILRVQGTGDLNGFFLDLNNDGGPLDRTTSYTTAEVQLNGGPVLAPTNATNMEGPSDGFDFAVQIGTHAGNDADVTSATVKIFGLTLASLQGAEVGIRMQSTNHPDVPDTYGPDREGSVKLTALPEPDAPPPDNFEKLDKGISNVVLYLKDPEPGCDKNGDGVYTVKIDNFPSDAVFDLDGNLEGNADPDSAWFKILAFLEEADADCFVLENLVGVHIKSGKNAFSGDGAHDTSTTNDVGFYALGDGDNNTDAFAEAGLSITKPILNKAIDASFDYADVFPPEPELLLI